MDREILIKHLNKKVKIINAKIRQYKKDGTHEGELTEAAANAIAYERGRIQMIRYVKKYL